MTTSFASLYSSRAVRLSSTSLGSSSTIRIRPSSLMARSPSCLLDVRLSAVKNRKSRLDRPLLRHTPARRGDEQCAERLPILFPCLRTRRPDAAAEIRRTACWRNAYQNRRRCPSRRFLSCLYFHPQNQSRSWRGAVRLRILRHWKAGSRQPALAGTGLRSRPEVHQFSKKYPVPLSVARSPKPPH